MHMALKRIQHRPTLHIKQSHFRVKRCDECGLRVGSRQERGDWVTDVVGGERALAEVVVTHMSVDGAGQDGRSGNVEGLDGISGFVEDLDGLSGLGSEIGLR